jgi:hypothetical protein
MMYFYGYCAFIALVILWCILKYRAETKNDRYLNRKIKQAAPHWKGVDEDEFMNELRDYDSRCQIEAERKGRDERC